MNKRGTNAPLQPDAVPNALQVSVLTRLNGAPHGLTAAGAGTRPDVLWRMERAGWVKVVQAGGIGTGHAWRPTDAGRDALKRIGGTDTKLGYNDGESERPGRTDKT